MALKPTLLLLLVLAIGPALHAAEAIQNVELGESGYVNDEVGFSFRPATNITLTSLGYVSDGANSASYVVQVLNGSGGILASATLTTSNLPPGQFTYTNIPPLRLPAGSTYFLTCYDASVFAGDGTKSWIGSWIIDGPTGDGGFGVAPAIQYLGATVGNNAFGGSNSPSTLLLGPNFEFLTGILIQPSELKITLTASNTVRVSWPASDTFGHLQAAPDLSASLTNVPGVPVISGTHQFMEFPTTGAGAFFRLAYPAGSIQPSELRITLTASNTVQVSWPASDTLGQLQTATDLGATMTDVPGVPVISGANQFMEFPATGVGAFFRLAYP